MGEVREVSVPDIGDFDEVPVIEILVCVGDEVAADSPLVTLESDKATMDVPAPFAGKVDEILVALGDKVSEGSRPADDRATARASGLAATDVAPATSALAGGGAGTRTAAPPPENGAARRPTPSGATATKPSAGGCRARVRLPVGAAARPRARESTSRG